MVVSLVFTALILHVYDTPFPPHRPHHSFPSTKHIPEAGSNDPGDILGTILSRWLEGGQKSLATPGMGSAVGTWARGQSAGASDATMTGFPQEGVGWTEDFRQTRSRQGSQHPRDTGSQRGGLAHWDEAQVAAAS